MAEKQNMTHGSSSRSLIRLLYIPKNKILVPVLTHFSDWGLLKMSNFEQRVFLYWSTCCTLTTKWYYNITGKSSDTWQSSGPIHIILSLETTHVCSDKPQKKSDEKQRTHLLEAGGRVSSSGRWRVRDIASAEEMWLLERKETPCDVLILQTEVTATR